MHELFIYGTLMPGLRLQAEMQGAERLGTARVPGRLVDVGRYPGFLHGDGQVSGEVYRVSEAQLAHLDEVEEMVPGDRAASQYWRERVTVQEGVLAGQQVWTYVYNLPVDGLTPIAHGDYRRYIREVGRES
ncbi:gamma-glutamylcyclotransferase family protein [Limnohabitans radicicola]|uniref:Gamma-glutamylcyclotransferase n=1 Tax=Limnohabitans radicicola TaxID=2771427 RepID=A0A927IMX2_9BURK|nr:gamma-glutamylcyclotransferase family protein [Limnohabitans radicicola]MBD8051457.1 gamma-glutamylcyclotransferase [Limnohabitans radicicola]